jgi:hypothetical protein
MKTVSKRYIAILKDLDFYMDAIKQYNLDIQNNEELEDSEKMKLIFESHKVSKVIRATQENLINIAKQLYGIEIYQKES